jgi:hypothetical protein
MAQRVLAAPTAEPTTNPKRCNFTAKCQLRILHETDRAPKKGSVYIIQQ